MAIALVATLPQLLFCPRCLGRWVPNAPPCARRRTLSLSGTGQQEWHARSIECAAPLTRGPARGPAQSPILNSVQITLAQPRVARHYDTHSQHLLKHPDSMYFEQHASSSCAHRCESRPSAVIASGALQSVTPLPTLQAWRPWPRRARWCSHFRPALKWRCVQPQAPLRQSRKAPRRLFAKPPLAPLKPEQRVEAAGSLPVSPSRRAHDAACSCAALAAGCCALRLPCR